MKNILKDGTVSPQNDAMFKNIFGKEETISCLQRFLSEVLEIPENHFANLTLGNSEQGANHKDGKSVVIDIKVQLTSGEIILVEMQKKNHTALRERMMYYNSRVFVDALDEGEAYAKLQKTITIMIVDFNFFRDAIDDYHDVFWMMSKKHCGRIFSKVQEIHVIELAKVPKGGTRRGLLLWMDLLNAQSLEEMYVIARDDKDLKKAVDTIKRFSDSEEFKARILREEIGARDDLQRLIDAKNDGLSEGKEEGLAEGEEIGLAKGEEIGLAKGEEIGLAKGVEKVVKNALENGLEISVIMNITGLSESEILEISKSIKNAT